MPKPILVFGTGRSGTSTVARLLHENLSICMGKRFREADEHNPQGYYEDLSLKSLNEAFLAGTLTFPAFQTALENELAQPWRSREQWGFKDPRLAELGGFYLQLIKDPVIFVCKRDIQETAKSIQRCYGFSKQNALKLVNKRNDQIENLLRERGWKIWFFSTKRFEDDLLTEKLKHFFGVE